MSRSSVIVANPLYQGSSQTAVRQVQDPKSSQWEEVDEAGFPEKKSRKGPGRKIRVNEKCTICNARATGFHYNVLSCEGCKNFFRRAIIKGLIYHCKTSKKVCCVQHNFRPRCQWCRLDKCFKMGMKAEYINRTKGKQLSIKSRELPERIRNLIETVKKSWEMATEGIEKASKPSYLSVGVRENDEFDHLPGIETHRVDFFIEMAFFKTKRITKFMNGLPGIYKLTSIARIWLFKESLAESMVMFNATTYNPAYQTRNSIVPAVRWLDGEWRGKDDFYKCGMRQEFVEPMFDLWKRIDDLKLDKQICALMMVLVLVNPDRQCPLSIKSELTQMNDIQEQFIEALQMYLERKYRSKSSAMLGNVMAILTNLRNISATTLQIQLTQLQKMEARMPTLLARLFTYDNHTDDVHITA